jgi:hypothetical protein
MRDSDDQCSFMTTGPGRQDWVRSERLGPWEFNLDAGFQMRYRSKFMPKVSGMISQEQPRNYGKCESKEGDSRREKM